MLLKKLEEERRVLKSKLYEINQKIEAEKIRLAEEKYGLCIGCVVKSHDGKEYKVTEITTSWDKPWVVGNPRKKDGTFGIAKRNVYGSWEVITDKGEIDENTRQL